MDNGDGCQYLEWDSEFFGCRIARLGANRLTEERIESVRKWCALHRIDCLYFLADAADAGTVRLAEDNGFRLTDIRVTLERQVAAVPNESESNRRIRPAVPGDVQALSAIARACHRDTRFYYDQRFSAEQCDALYATWIEKSCNGYADVVLVADVEGRAVGYISCQLLDRDNGQIGLVGIDEAFQGKALGTGLVKESLLWFAQRGAKQVTVVTQGRNWRAQRLYQRCGFVTKAVQLWYHHWLTPASAAARV